MRRDPSPHGITVNVVPITAVSPRYSRRPHYRADLYSVGLYYLLVSTRICFHFFQASAVSDSCVVLEVMRRNVPSTDLYINT